MRSRYIQAEFLTADGAFIDAAKPAKSITTLRWNAANSSYLTVPEAHRVLPDLITEPGVRCAVWMVTNDPKAANPLVARRLLEGRVGTLQGVDAPRGSVTIPVVDDFQEFDQMLGWQAPAAAIGGQSAAEYARYSGKSEANAKAAIAANAARLGKAWDVVADRGLGTVGPLELRMHGLGEAILAPLRADRLQLTIERVKSTGRWTVDVRGGSRFPRPLTPQSGVLTKWSWVQQPPTATRCVVGGRGEGVEREFVLVIDEALEAALGVVLEVYVDARNAEGGADLAPYGWAELAKHTGKSGLTAELRETSWFQFPERYDVGDVVPIQIGALSVDDVISQIVISHDVASGFSVVPTVGLATNEPDERLVNYVQSVATSVGALERR